MIGDMEILIIVIIMNVLNVVYLHACKPWGIKVAFMQHFMSNMQYFSCGT